MNPIALCLAAGAMSLAKCEPSLGSLEPFALRRQHDPFLQELRKSQNTGFNYKKDKKFKTANENKWTEISEKKNSETKVAENDGDKNTIFQEFRQLHKINSLCKNNTNKAIKSEACKWPLGKSSREYLTAFYECVKIYIFGCLDDVLGEVATGRADGAYLAETEEDVAGVASPPTSKNITSLVRKPLQFFGDHASNVLSKDWTALMYERLKDLLHRYSMKFQIHKIFQSQGRGRRRDHRMFAMMVMGFMIMASILIPMGFQFLTVLGGKSLLMAKMALIMSAINGLKKIATSNVGYGFYHTGSDGHHHDHVHHGFHEKLYHAGPQGSAAQYSFAP